MVNLAPTMRVLITGGAGFVGANLGICLAERHSDWELVAYDNLYRRGSELNLPRLDQAGIAFVKGDVRDLEELSAIEEVDALIECSAEPSVLAGADGETGYTVHTNLMGAYNCLEICRRDGSQLVFLSTSRVYPMRPQSELAYDEGPTRFELSDDQEVEGASPAGISEDFPLHGARSLYGATKLAAELLIEEYAAGFGLRTVVDRCGVITGPWQMGKVDQGVFAFWLFHHYFGLPLSYIGYGGDGKAGARSAAHRRPSRAGGRAARRPGWLGGLRGQRRGRPGQQPLAARDDRDLPGADRPRGPDRAGTGDPAG